MSQSRIVIRRSSDNQHYFNLIAANNEKILTSERYTSHSSAVNGAQSVKVNAPHDDRYDRLASGHQFYFTLRAANGETLGTSEMYTSRGARDEGVEAVKRNAIGAEVVDA